MLNGGLTDAAKQKMIANQLRNRSQVSDISMLSGDPKLAKFGEELNQDVGRSQAAALTARGGEQERVVQKAYYDQLAQQNALANTMESRRMSETERHDRAMELASGGAMERQKDKDIQKLAANMQTSGIPALRDAVNNVSGLMDKAGNDLPGVGMTGSLPQFMLTKEGQKMRQGYAQVRNMLLRARSGQAVTDAESARLAEELGASPSDETLITAWPRVLAQVDAMEKAIKAGFDDDTVKTFEERQKRGATSVPAAGAPPASGGKTVKWSDLGR
jgi:hypothetical protein